MSVSLLSVRTELYVHMASILTRAHVQPAMKESTVRPVSKVTVAATLGTIPLKRTTSIGNNMRVASDCDEIALVGHAHGI